MSTTTGFSYRARASQNMGSQSTTVTEQTGPEKGILDWFRFLGMYFTTLWLVLTNPKKVVDGRYIGLRGIYHPAAAVVIGLIVFSTIAALVPVFSEPVFHRGLKAAAENAPALFGAANFFTVVGKYAFSLMILVGGSAVVLVLFLINDGEEYKAMARVAAYMTFAILNLFLLRYFIPLLFIMPCTKFNFGLSLILYPIGPVRFIDLILLLIFLIPVLAYPYYLFKEKNGWAFVAVILFYAVLFAFGFTFRKELARKPLKESSVSLPPDDPKPGDTTAQKDSILIKVPAPQNIKTDSLQRAADSIKNTPANKTILLTPAPQEDAAVHAEAHRFRGNHWLQIAYTLTNTTSQPVRFPADGKAKVYLSVGGNALRTREPDPAKAKLFNFEIISRAPGAIVLAGKQSTIVNMRCSISANMFRYIKEQYLINRYADRDIFIELQMQSEQNPFPVNRQTQWDMLFH